MIKDFFTFLWGGLIAFLSWFFGGLDGTLSLLIVLAVVDYLSGICVGWLNHNLSSSIGFKGIARKILMFALVGIANIIDYSTGATPLAAKTVVCLFYISNEGLSILENAYKLGLPVPDILAKHFSDLCSNHKKEVLHNCQS